MNLRRAMHSKVFHQADCRMAVNAFHWTWADDRDIHDMRIAVRRHPWLHPCKICKPLDGKP